MDNHFQTSYQISEALNQINEYISTLSEVSNSIRAIIQERRIRRQTAPYTFTHNMIMQDRLHRQPVPYPVHAHQLSVQQREAERRRIAMTPQMFNQLNRQIIHANQENLVPRNDINRCSIVRPVDNIDYTDKCVICLSLFASDGKEIRVLQCTHKFHRHCVDWWLTYNPNCPICRFSLYGNQYNDEIVNNPTESVTDDNNSGTQSSSVTTFVNENISQANINFEVVPATVMEMSSNVTASTSGVNLKPNEVIEINDSDDSDTESRLKCITLLKDKSVQSMSSTTSEYNKCTAEHNAKRSVMLQQSLVNLEEQRVSTRSESLIQVVSDSEDEDI